MRLCCRDAVLKIGWQRGASAGDRRAGKGNTGHTAGPMHDQPKDMACCGGTASSGAVGGITPGGRGSALGVRRAWYGQGWAGGAVSGVQRRAGLGGACLRSAGVCGVRERGERGTGKGGDGARAGSRHGGGDLAGLQQQEQTLEAAEQAREARRDDGVPARVGAAALRIRQGGGTQAGALFGRRGSAI